MFDLSNVAFLPAENAEPGAGPAGAANVAPAVDPIFAAIERLRAAEARHAAADIACDEAMVKRDARAKAEAEALRDRTLAELRAEEAAFLSTVPLTLDGVRAGLAYAFEYDADGHELRPFVESILRSPAWTPALADPLLTAIERHKAAVRAVAAYPGPGDLPSALTAEEDAASRELAAVPCGESFPVKLRYMLADQKRRWGPLWRIRGAPEIMAAIELHVSGEITA
ncbi:MULTISPECIES: hypothetical protein [Methylosinus]|uniref:Uncharacterized protein n=1 Tax=Methylosinus trichosporium (strain ATCC 35070 / NCIMB 11131 / UNIQEM 75 / OB3b) TaxID=595536 RepID=A0A2D2CYI2_METT3|nr:MULTISPECIES: hypothetical protein [Methylosinus]ATQ67709.1 hypothetical protein CQW49_07260 [Methylosinus trichosporium OB3b]OBS51182.1 hypothetical protein A8B73_17845 [Methylosinus sp. 3S-1]